MFHGVPVRAICRRWRNLRGFCGVVPLPAYRVRSGEPARRGTVDGSPRCSAMLIRRALACVGRVQQKAQQRVDVPGFAWVWRDYSTRQARTPPASFFVAVFQRFTCRAQLANATAAGLSGKRNESPGTISRSSGVIRFVTVLRGGGGMFFVIIGCASTVPHFRCQWVNSFPSLARFVFSADSVPSVGAIVFRAQLILFLFCCAASGHLYSPPRSAVQSRTAGTNQTKPHPDNDHTNRKPSRTHPRRNR